MARGDAKPATVAVELAHHWRDADGVDHVPEEVVDVDPNLAQALVNAAYATYANAKAEKAAAEATAG
jgi:hypothetical protein